MRYDNKFSEKEQRLANVAKALSHPARIAILQFLATTNSCMCKDIVDELPLAQSTVSQHLKELKKVGLIKGNIEAPSICYCIDQTGFQEAKEILAVFVGEIESKVRNCC